MNWNKFAFLLLDNAVKYFFISLPFFLVYYVFFRKRFPYKKIKVKFIEVGEKFGTYWVLFKGLESGDRVAIVGTLFVQPGSVVEPIPFAENVEKDVSNKTE